MNGPRLMCACECGAEISPGSQICKKCDEEVVEWLNEIGRRINELALQNRAAPPPDVTCLSCGARTDSDGKLPCGH